MPVNWNRTTGAKYLPGYRLRRRRVGLSPGFGLVRGTGLIPGSGLVPAEGGRLNSPGCRGPGVDYRSRFWYQA